MVEAETPVEIGKPVENEEKFEFSLQSVIRFSLLPAFLSPLSTQFKPPQAISKLPPSQKPPSH
jgi:hypothetical protein